MAYTLQQLSDLYAAMATRIAGLPTNEQITALTDLVTVQHTTILDLISALTTRVDNLEDWRLTHSQDEDAHT